MKMKNGVKKERVTMSIHFKTLLGASLVQKIDGMKDGRHKECQEKEDEWTTKHEMKPTHQMKQTRKQASQDKKDYKIRASPTTKQRKKIPFTSDFGSLFRFKNFGCSFCSFNTNAMFIILKKDRNNNNSRF